MKPYSEVFTGSYRVSQMKLKYGAEPYTRHTGHINPIDCTLTVKGALRSELIDAINSERPLVSIRHGCSAQ